MRPFRISARKRRSLGPKAAHDAEVDGNDLACRIDQQIALMHIGVEKPIAHGVPQKRAQERQAQLV